MPTPIYWTPERVDEVFDKTANTLERTPTHTEFSKLYKGAIAAITGGRYKAEITTWKQYLEYRGLKSHRESWTPERIDEVFDKMREEFGRTPTHKELVKVYGGAISAIENGRYNPEITTLKQYMEHRNLSLTPKKIDQAFDKLAKELGRSPTSREFRKYYQDAYSAIRYRRYNLQINTWTQYLIHRGIKPNREFWSPDKVDRIFDEEKARLGRTPTYEEFQRFHGGALSAIERGRYNKQIRNWGQYLAHRGLLKISTPEQLSSLLEQNPTARSLVGLAGFNGYGHDIAAVLKELFPDRFVDEENLSRMLAESTISGAIYPFTAPGGEIIPPVDLVPPELPPQIKGRLEDLVYRISIEYYGPQFNRDPRGSVAMLEERSQSNDPFVSGLMRRVKEYYEGILDFEIPGVGKLKQKV